MIENIKKVRLFLGLLESDVIDQALNVQFLFITYHLFQ